MADSLTKNWQEQFARLAKDQVGGPARRDMLAAFEASPDLAVMLEMARQRAEGACWRGWALVDEVEHIISTNSISEKRPWIARVVLAADPRVEVGVRGATPIDAFLRMERHLRKASPTDPAKTAKARLAGRT